MDDEFEEVVINIFFKSIEAKEYALGLNLEVLKAYCERYELDFLATYELLSVLLNALNKQRLKVG